MRAVLKERGGNPALANASISELVSADAKSLETCMRVLSRPTRLVRGKMDADADLNINEASFECDEERALYAAYGARQNHSGCSVCHDAAISEIDGAATAFFDNVLVWRKILNEATEWLCARPSEPRLACRFVSSEGRSDT